MGLSKSQNHILGLYEGMSSEGQQALTDYALFLSERYAEQDNVITEPLDISRPDEESVVIAIRRLSMTYPMLDRQALLHDTSAFMMQHVVKGRVASEVIDELEDYFRQQYENHQASVDNV